MSKEKHDHKQKSKLSEYARQKMLKGPKPKVILSYGEARSLQEGGGDIRVILVKREPACRFC